MISFLPVEQLAFTEIVENLGPVPLVLKVVAELLPPGQDRALHLTNSLSAFLMICFHQAV